MKIRNGFVSNSSSSSFMVGFPRIPESKEDLKNMMFSKGEKFIDALGCQTMSIEHIAQIVFQEITKKTPYDWRELAEYLFSKINEIEKKDKVVEDLIFDSKVGSIEENQLLDDDDRKFMKKFTMKLSKNKKFKDKIFFKFEYSDNDPEGVLEHGDIFYNLLHWKIDLH